jgi:hypothetical protein
LAEVARERIEVTEEDGGERLAVDDLILDANRCPRRGIVR